ncbi:hypothetical protein LWC35_26135 [Pseudonocardia kujensis]|uniref:hypothetical protein n=1 Tax=Pseudonocardia kujensis TaxID=1128675 RepID=UPI001E5746E6|nr:hypothetical protein [Pseudonocardia kujensis]MCE0766355.1 hypothetical protein [Pseudonocardia kujensis]
MTIDTGPPLAATVTERTELGDFPLVGLPRIAPGRTEEEVAAVVVGETAAEVRKGAAERGQP